MIRNANGCNTREFTLTIGRSQHSDDIKTAHAFLCMGCQVQIRLRVSGNSIARRAGLVRFCWRFEDEDLWVVDDEGRTPAFTIIRTRTL